MKNNQTRAWTKDLRTTDAPQVTGQLVDEVDLDKFGYCCLGRLCVVAGITMDEEAWTFGGYDGVPPGYALRWLGINTAEECGTIYVDFTPGLADRKNQEYRSFLADCTHLNDGLKLTFPQIADLVDYFGVQE